MLSIGFRGHMMSTQTVDPVAAEAAVAAPSLDLKIILMISFLHFKCTRQGVIHPVYGLSKITHTADLGREEAEAAAVVETSESWRLSRELSGRGNTSQSFSGLSAQPQACTNFSMPSVHIPTAPDTFASSVHLSWDSELTVPYMEPLKIDSSQHPYEQRNMLAHRHNEY